MKFLLEIIKHVSSANNIDSDTKFILRGRYMYMMSSKGSRIDPGGTPCFKYPSQRKKFLVVLGDFT